MKFRVEQTTDVKNAKSAPIQVYDYYDKGIINTFSALLLNRGGGESFINYYLEKIPSEFISIYCIIIIMF